MNSSYLFANRIDAAEQLATALAAYKGRHPQILAIPCGALPLGKVLAAQLDGQLDIVLAHKLSAPFDDEYAIGGIDESGWSYLTPVAQESGISADYITGEKNRRLSALRRRRAEIEPYRAPVDPHGRVVIVVDDGIATGATMVAALHAIRAREPAELVCAVPVGAPDSLAELAPLVDRLVCIAAPPNFRGVGQFYRDFPQVDDLEAMQILAVANGTRNADGADGAIDQR